MVKRAGHATAGRVTMSWVRASVLMLLVVTLGACGGHSPGSTFQVGDASVSSTDADAPDGPFACGLQPGVVCEPAQYCVTGCSGGPIFCSALLDSGVCPSGTALSTVAVCPGDASPCVGGTFYPTECVDDLEAAPCPNPGPVGPAQTFACECPI